MMKPLTPRQQQILTEMTRYPVFYPYHYEQRICIALLKAGRIVRKDGGFVIANGRQS